MKFHLLLKSARRLTLAVGLLAAACSATPAASGTPTASPAAGGVIAQGRLEPAGWVDLAFILSGVVAAVPVTEEQTVQAGYALAVLAAPVV